MTENQAWAEIVRFIREEMGFTQRNIFYSEAVFNAGTLAELKQFIRGLAKERTSEQWADYHNARAWQEITAWLRIQGWLDNDCKTSQIQSMKDFISLLLNDRRALNRMLLQWATSLEAPLIDRVTKLEEKEVEVDSTLDDLSSDLMTVTRKCDGNRGNLKNAIDRLEKLEDMAECVNLCVAANQVDVPGTLRSSPKENPWISSDIEMPNNQRDVKVIGNGRHGNFFKCVSGKAWTRNNLGDCFASQGTYWREIQ